MLRRLATRGERNATLRLPTIPRRPAVVLSSIVPTRSSSIRRGATTRRSDIAVCYQPRPRIRQPRYCGVAVVLLVVRAKTTLDKTMEASDPAWT